MDWIDLAQDRNKWRAFVSAVMSLRFMNPHSATSQKAAFFKKTREV
jgi:hypothetical protein